MARLSHPRFEIVRTDEGHHARFVAGNGRIVWTTEVYSRRGRAVDAIEILCNASMRDAGHPEVLRAQFHIEVRDVDERGAES